MSDKYLRDLQRTAHTGSVDDKAALLVARLRAGHISLFQLMMAAWLNNQPATVALSNEEQVNVGWRIDQGIWVGHESANMLQHSLEDMANRWSHRITLLSEQAVPSEQETINVLFRMCFAALYEHQTIAWETWPPETGDKLTDLRISNSLDEAVQAMYELRRVFQSRYLVDMQPIPVVFPDPAEVPNSLRNKLRAQYSVLVNAHQTEFSAWRRHLLALLFLEEAFRRTMDVVACSACHGKGEFPTETWQGYEETGVVPRVGLRKTMCQLCEGTGITEVHAGLGGRDLITRCLTQCLADFTEGRGSQHPRVNVDRIIAAIQKDVLPWCVGETGDDDPMMGYTDLCGPHQLKPLSIRHKLD